LLAWPSQNFVQKMASSSSSGVGDLAAPIVSGPAERPAGMSSSRSGGNSSHNRSLSLEELYQLIEDFGVANKGELMQCSVACNNFIDELYNISNADGFKEILKSSPVPGPDFWFDWIAQVKATSNNNASTVLDALRTSVHCCPDFQLVKALTDFVKEKHDSEELVI
jgi:hypothetical protein